MNIETAVKADLLEHVARGGFCFYRVIPAARAIKAPKVRK